MKPKPRASGCTLVLVPHRTTAALCLGVPKQAPWCGASKPACGVGGLASSAPSRRLLHCESPLHRARFPSGAVWRAGCRHGLCRCGAPLRSRSCPVHGLWGCSWHRAARRGPQALWSKRAVWGPSVRIVPSRLFGYIGRILCRDHKMRPEHHTCRPVCVVCGVSLARPPAAPTPRPVSRIASRLVCASM